MSLLTTIDDRTREIFRRVVEAYIETGEPVGSRTLSQAGGLNVSPATIRNVLSDLTDMGLLYAPHVSAGRMPTQQGLRLFVDGLLQVGDVSEVERKALAEQEGSGRSADDILSGLAARLSGLTQTAGLVMATKGEAPLKHIEFVQTSPEKALVVLVSGNGDVENRIIDLPPGLPPAALVEAGNYLSARLKGRTLAEAKSVIEVEIQENRAAINELTAELVRKGVAELASDGANLIVRGQANLLNTDNEADLERVRMLIEDLEQKKDVIELMEAAREGRGVRIFIGSENRLFSLSGSSVVVSPYRDEGDNIIGVVGVVGPTRLDYARIIPMVDYTAEIVTRLLK